MHYGFKVGNKDSVKKVEIKDGNIVLTLKDNEAIDEGTKVKVTFDPSKASGGKTLKLVDTPLKKSEELTMKIGEKGTLRWVMRNQTAQAQKTDEIVLSVDKELVDNTIENGPTGFVVTANMEDIPVIKMQATGKKITLTLGKELPVGTQVKVVYEPNDSNIKKLSYKGAELKAEDILPTEGIVSETGTIVTQVPKTDNSSRGFGGGRSSVRPNTPERKSDDKKDIKMVDELPPIKPDSKVSTKLTIGDMKYTVVVDGQGVERTMDVAPMVHMGRTVLPARMISEILGVEVKYEPATRTANFMYQDAKVQLTLGQKFMMVNGKPMPLTADILNVKGRILLPLTDIQKAFAELGLKANVEWDADTKSVTVNK